MPSVRQRFLPPDISARPCYLRLLWLQLNAKANSGKPAPPDAFENTWIPAELPSTLLLALGKKYCSIIVSGYFLSRDHRVLKWQMKLTLLTLVLTEAIVLFKVIPWHLLPELTWLAVQHNSHFSDLIEGHTSILFYYYLTLAEMLLSLRIDFNQSKSCAFNRFMKERKISDAVVSHLSFYGIIQSFFLGRPSIFSMYLFAHPWNLFTSFNLKPHILSC